MNYIPNHLINQNRGYMTYLRQAAYSSADLSAGIVNQDNTTSNQSGLTVDTYPVGVAVNPVTKKIYATNELSNSLSVISEH